ncbi:MAG: 3-methyl-2-oxobutanoate hydroxymethyltransferase [Gammaproteobacteria bacterium]|nr:3-methyl-2-oxobutanoate hydroxymethyltransferase [Gammaproteobacteria bacterium]
MSKITVATLKKMKAAGEKFVCLTAYDALFAQVLEAAGIEILLVGDSLGMVIQGHESTLPVTIDDIVYHTQTVHRGSKQALIMADMPFMSYINETQALENAARVLKEGGAHIVKLEGGAAFAGIVRQLTAHGIPVCGHLGLLPQSVNKIGGYKVQGTDAQSAKSILNDAKILEQAGCDVMLLECVPLELARQVTESLSIPVIGIGAGPHCDGQVLVLQDMLGITPGKRPRFTHDFLKDTGSVSAAVEAYVKAVKTGAFPLEQHSFTA